MEAAIWLAAASPENHAPLLRGMPAERKKPSYEPMQRWAQDERRVEVSNKSAVPAQAVMHGLRDGTMLLFLRTWTAMIAGDETSDFICSDTPVSLESTKPRTDWSTGKISTTLPRHSTTTLIARQSPW